MHQSARCTQFVLPAYMGHFHNSEKDLEKKEKPKRKKKIKASVFIHEQNITWSNSEFMYFVIIFFLSLQDLKPEKKSVACGRNAGNICRNTPCSSPPECNNPQSRLRGLPAAVWGQH